MAWKVFLCDDDVGYRQLVRAVLESAGVEVVGEGGDGVECIAKAPGAGADVILLDVNMPRLDGWATLPELQASAPDAHVVMLSTAPAGDVDPKRLGATAFIEKPRDVFALPDLLHDALAA